MTHQRIELKALPLLGVKDILVHLDGSSEDDIRIAHGESLASTFGGRLTGVYTNVLPDVANYAAPEALATCVELENRILAEGELVGARLARRFAPRELRRIDAQPSEMRRAVATEARWADLFVGTCPRGGTEKWNSVIEEVLFQGGRGVFLAPEAIKPRAAIRTVAFACKDTREAARALAEAMPFLRIATSTHVIVVDEGAARLDAGPRMADIASHLARHGVSAKVDLATQAAGGTAASILDAAHRAGADLIVSGAYGHSRLREWILGGVTRALIETSDIPLLMAH